jgi:hypothetical protein
MPGFFRSRATLEVAESREGGCCVVRAVVRGPIDQRARVPGGARGWAGLVSEVPAAGRAAGAEEDRAGLDAAGATARRVRQPARRRGVPGRRAGPGARRHAAGDGPDRRDVRAGRGGVAAYCVEDRACKPSTMVDYRPRPPGADECDGARARCVAFTRGCRVSPTEHCCARNRWAARTLRTSWMSSEWEFGAEFAS